jgi:hypothetical protein
MHTLNSKVVLSALLALAVSSLFCLSSLTTLANNNELSSSSDDAPVTAARIAPAGVLSGTGTLSLNGISTEAGATVYSGSIITTGHDGIASIDLGAIGRFVVRPRTTVTVTLGPGSAIICDRAKATRVSVLRGELIVMSAEANRTLKSGDDAVFAESIEATMTGDTVFTIQDQGTPKDHGPKDAGAQNPNIPVPDASPSPSPKRRNAVIAPWWGWLGMAGAAGGIAAGIATHGGERSSANRVSSTLP